jgi:hypothetical protein
MITTEAMVAEAPNKDEPGIPNPRSDAGVFFPPDEMRACIGPCARLLAVRAS